jgi:hypothetical protein
MTIPFGLTVSLSQMTNRRFRGSFADENGKGIPQKVRRSRILDQLFCLRRQLPSFPVRLNESFSVSDDNKVKIQMNLSLRILSQMTTPLLSGSPHRRFLCLR